MKCIRYIYSLCLCFCAGVSTAQTDIVSFSKNQYAAGAQNWSVQTDRTGCIYIANNEGLLTYNGTKWELFPLPNQTIVRFILFGEDGRLYAGGQDEFGYFQPDQTGRLAYTSLLPLIEKQDRQFADIWNIVAFNGDLFFRSSSKIFRFHQQKIYSYRTTAKWEFLGIHQGRLIAQDKSRGLLAFRGNEWESFMGAEALPSECIVTSMSSFDKRSLVATIRHGLFTLDQNRLVPFAVIPTGSMQSQHITSLQQLENGNLLLGTYENGLYLLDREGKLIQTYTKLDGLNSNNIKCVFSAGRSVWVAQEDGISCLNLNNPVKWVNPSFFNGEAGYSASVFNGHVYFALANGVYEMPLMALTGSRISDESIRRIAGQLSWNITNIDGRLLVGRDDGFFEISKGALQPVDQSTGYWIFRKLNGTNNAAMLFAAGNYTGINIFSATNDTYVKVNDLSHLNTSARFMQYDPAAGVVWISHPYRGVYRISMADQSVKQFTEKEGLPATLDNHVFKIKGQIVIATKAGIYQYNAGASGFEKAPLYEKIFKTTSIRYLQEDYEGNIWFVHEKSIGVVDHLTNSIIYFPELQRKILSGFESVLPIDSSHVLIGADRGFYLIDLVKYRQNRQVPEVFIRNVTMRKNADSVLFGGYHFNHAINEQPPQLNAEWNAYHFGYSSPFHNNAGSLEYSYRLNGFDKNWSDWTEKTEKDYTNLPPGKYTFEVKVRNNLNEESAVASYRFQIAYPWYNTIWARLLLFLLLAALLYAFYKMQERKFQRRQELKVEEERRKNEEKERMLSYQHQLELEKTEKELMLLKNEKLESELASTAMNLVQKKEFLLKIKSEISKLNKTEQENIDTTELKRILRSLAAEDKLDEEWDQFSIHFNKVHGDFLRNLKNRFPGLRSHDLRLCAYLRMNLSSKEIAQLMSISVRGVEISRYRLRKRLQVPAKEDLFYFLLGLDDNTNENPA